MLIIRTTDDVHAASGIQELAGQVLYSSEDMECVGDRNDLLKLRIPALPLDKTLNPVLLLVRQLNEALHEKMSAPIHRWATNNGFRIEPAAHGRPTIVWIQGGGIICPKGKISIFILLRRPIPRQGGGVIDGAEGSVTGEIRTPMGDLLLSSSKFECQVGDLVILDGEEQLVVRGDQGRGISAFCVMHLKKEKGTA